MITLRPVYRLLLFLALIGAPNLAAAAIPRLSAPPLGERWFSVQMGGDRVGFAHQTIVPSGEGYLIRSEGSVKMLVMGFSRDASSKESYLVGQDLSLKSFQVEETIDGSRAVATGEVTPAGIKVVIERGGSRKEQILKAKGAVYPPSALNFLPLMQKAKEGKSYKFSMFDPEAVKVKRVTVTVVGTEGAGYSERVHLKNDIYSFVDNDVWLDQEGNTVRESVRDDLVVTTADDEKKVKAFLAEAALAKNDLILDYSLIRVETIEKPDQLKLLSVDFTGIPRNLPLLQGIRQKTLVFPDGTTRFIMAPAGATPHQEPGPGNADLEPSERIPSDSREIITLAGNIAGAEKEPARKVERLTAWVTREIKGTVTDSQSPLETLQKRNGNCQSHARLYAALARAEKIPTRFVSGVVYLPKKGFLYHSWAESYLEGQGWVPVDPTFGQNPTDLTHIKLAQGDSVEDMTILAGMIGKVQAKVVEQKYQ